MATPPPPRGRQCRPARRRHPAVAATAAAAAVLAAVAVALASSPSAASSPLVAGQPTLGDFACPPAAHPPNYACSLAVEVAPSPHSCGFAVTETIVLPAPPGNGSSGGGGGALFTRVLPSPVTAPSAVPHVVRLRRLRPAPAVDASVQTAAVGEGGGGGLAVSWPAPAGGTWAFEYELQGAIVADATTVCAPVAFKALPGTGGGPAGPPSAAATAAASPPPASPSSPSPGTGEGGAPAGGAAPGGTGGQVGGGNEDTTHVVSWAVPPGTTTAASFTVSILSTEPTKNDAWAVVGAAATPLGARLAARPGAAAQVGWAAAPLTAAGGTWVAWLQPRVAGPLGAPGPCGLAGCPGATRAAPAGEWQVIRNS